MTDTNADMDVKPDEQPIVVEKRDGGIVRPGDLSAKLQACRERADLDQDQAAIAMRLSPAMIKALEGENFAELPDPPYVRGYLRSYARLDESDPQDLIRTYEVLRGADPDSLNIPLPVTLTRVHKPSISPTTVRMLGLVALVLLLGVLSMIPGINQWVKQTWQSFAAAQPGSAPTMIAAQKTNPPATTTAPATGTSTDLTATQPIPTPSSPALASTTQDNPASSTGSELVQPSPSLTTGTENSTGTNTTEAATSATTPSASTPPESTASSPTTNTPNPTSSTESNPATTAAMTLTAATTADPNTTTASTNSSSSASTSPATTTPASSATATGTLEPTATSTPAVDPNKPAETAATTQQPIDGEVTVRMEFTQEVWMQVKDGSNKSIFESLNSPNTWKQFKTRTPLTFKIGNAPGVKLYLNGQAYDHAKYTRGSVARFTVN